MNKSNLIHNEWVQYIKQIAIFSLLGGCVVGVIGVVLSKAKFSHLPAILLVALALSVFIFLLYFITTVLPNYIFYKKLLKSNKEAYIAENIEKYGLHFLMKNLWFIWPREFDEKYQKKARRNKKGSE